jgi:hypothetical protein
MVRLNSVEIYAGCDDDDDCQVNWVSITSR